MSTREESRDVVNPRIPVGYKVTYHELRGYDSPDKWYEAHHGDQQIGEFGRCDQAVDACIEHSKKAVTPKTSDTITFKIKRVSVLVYEDQSPDRLSIFLNASPTFPEAGYEPALDTQCAHGLAVKWLRQHFPDLDEKLVEVTTVPHYRAKFSSTKPEKNKSRKKASK